MTLTAVQNATITTKTAEVTSEKVEAEPKETQARVGTNEKDLTRGKKTILQKQIVKEKDQSKISKAVLKYKLRKPQLERLGKRGR